MADDPAPGLGRERGGRLGQLGGVARGDDDIDAFERELPGDGAADALASAGYQRALALELQIHAGSPVGVFR